MTNPASFPRHSPSRHITGDDDDLQWSRFERISQQRFDGPSLPLLRSESDSPCPHVDVLIIRRKGKSKEETEKRKEGLRMVKCPLVESDLTPWLRRTEWPDYFTGKDIPKMAEASHHPAKDDKALCRVTQSVDRLFESCVGVVKTCEQRGWTMILRWMRSYVPTVPDKAPFRIDYAKNTRNKYTLLWKRLICCCLRALEQEVRQHEFRENEQQLLRQIQGKISTPAAGVDDNSLDNLVFQLSVN